MRLFPVIARQAEHLTVFQRTAQFAVPARHHTVDQAFLARVKANYAEIWKKCKSNGNGHPYDVAERSALEVSDEKRQATYESLWA